MSLSPSMRNILSATSVGASSSAQKPTAFKMEVAWSPPHPEYKLRKLPVVFKAGALVAKLEDTTRFLVTIKNTFWHPK